MKITCTQENLSRSLSFLERATGKQTTLPILSNFLLTGEKGQLRLSATNLEIGVVSSISAKVDGNGEIAVPVKIVSNFVHNLPQGDIVSLELSEKTLSMESSGHSLRVRGLDPKDFPIIPEKKGEYTLSFPAQRLKTTLQRLLPCVSVNESRIELTGVNFLFFEREIHIAATDSFRLAEGIFKFDEGSIGKGYDDFYKEVPSLILPQMTLQELTRIISPETEVVRMAFEENQVFFDIDGVSLVSRVINGKYPDYKQILPKKYEYSVKISKDEFIRAVRMASIFSSQMSGEMSIILSPEKGELVVSSRSSEVGENKTVLHGEIIGDGDLQILFNPRYILDGLNVVDTDTLLFSANSNSTPVSFQMVGENGSAVADFLYIAMPIRK